MAIVKYAKERILNPVQGLTADIMHTEILFDDGLGRMINFVVLQLLEANGQIYMVKMHDFSDGVYNVHCFYKNLNDRKEYPNEVLSRGLFELCKTDIVGNWFEYKSRFARKYNINI